MGRALGHVAWSDLSQVVYEQVSVLVELLQSSDEKVRNGYVPLIHIMLPFEALIFRGAEGTESLTSSLNSLGRSKDGRVGEIRKQ